MATDRLSDNRDHLNAMQRIRRRYCRRIDYYASQEALAAIETRRTREHPGSVLATNGAVLDAIICEWAALTGINNHAISKPLSSAQGDGVFRHLRAPAYEFGDDSSARIAQLHREGKPKPSATRVVCGARRHRDGGRCKALSEPGKKRCKWHGGRSTGPKTAAGRQMALANLQRGRRAAGIRSGSADGANRGGLENSGEEIS